MEKLTIEEMICHSIAPELSIAKKEELLAIRHPVIVIDDITKAEKIADLVIDLD
ncbi:MAG: hypothetical protein WC716_16600 [Chitinophagaceae bacterium]